jgi:hypothetical protein
MIRDDGATYGKAHAEPAWLGGMKGREDLLDAAGIESGPGVGHRRKHFAFAAGASCLRQSSSSFWSRFNSSRRSSSCQASSAVLSAWGFMVHVYLIVLRLQQRAYSSLIALSTLRF